MMLSTETSAAERIATESEAGNKGVELYGTLKLKTKSGGK